MKKATSNSVTAVFLAVSIVTLVWMLLNIPIWGGIFDSSILLSTIAIFTVGALAGFVYFLISSGIAWSFAIPIVLALMFLLPFIQINIGTYSVVIKTDGFQVLKSRFAIINPLDRFKIEKVRNLSLDLEERKFEEAKTASYHFVDLRVRSVLTTDDDFKIYESSRSNTSVISEVMDYIVKQIKAGVRDKEILEQSALDHFKDRIISHRQPVEIEIRSLAYVAE